MAICVLVLKSLEQANQFGEGLKCLGLPVIKCQLASPSSNSEALISKTTSNILETRDIDSIELLNPRLAKQKMQKRMALWLMPFGFITGLAFTQMTGLKTFSGLGIGPLGDPLIGSLLGMFSGWLGSYTSASTLNTEESKDIEDLQQFNIQGLWLLILETPSEVPLPWKLINEIVPVKVVRLNG